MAPKQKSLKKRFADNETSESKENKSPESKFNKNKSTNKKTTPTMKLAKTVHLSTSKVESNSSSIKPIRNTKNKKRKQEQLSSDTLPPHTPQPTISASAQTKHFSMGVIATISLISVASGLAIVFIMF